MLCGACMSEINLGELDLSDCGLGDGDVEGLKHVVKSCPNLTLLNLRYTFELIR